MNLGSVLKTRCLAEVSTFFKKICIAIRAVSVINAVFPARGMDSYTKFAGANHTFDSHESQFLLANCCLWLGRHLLHLKDLNIFVIINAFSSLAVLS